MPSQESENPLAHEAAAASTQARERQTPVESPVLERKKQEFEQYAPAPSARPAITNKHNARIPICAAHRGFKLRYPENTLGAFRGALDAGANALETDLHVSRDDVVVLSHDPSLERCFGVKKKVEECDWEYMANLKTVDEPKDRMPRLVDLLDFLDHEELEDVWVLLDIKLDNDPDRIIPLVSQVLASHAPVRTSKPWHSRFVLGCWSARFLPLCARHLPDIPITLICFDISYARQFLTDATPNVSFNINQKILMGPLGKGFLDEVRQANRLIYAWTVNEPNLMRWCIRHGIDAALTDDPILFSNVAAQWKGQKDGFVGDGDGAGKKTKETKEQPTLGQKFQIWTMSVLVLLFGWAFKLRYLPAVEKVKAEKAK